MHETCVPKVMRTSAIDKKTKENNQKNTAKDHIEKAQQFMGWLTSETASARRFAAALGNFGIQSSTLSRLSSFAQEGEEAFAKLLAIVHADAAGQATAAAEVEDILSGVGAERSWFLSVRASYDQMLRSKKIKKSASKTGDELEAQQPQPAQQPTPPTS